MHQRLLWLSLCLGGCSGPSADLWGVLHGDVTVGEDGSVDGVLVWEMFESDWADDLDPERHLCGRVLHVAGESSPSGCAECAVDAALVVEEIQTDCPGVEGSTPALVSMDRLRLLPVNGKIAGAWPDYQWAWALGWAGGEPAQEGVAWDEGFEFGDPPADGASVLGRRLRLGPANARAFRDADLPEPTAP